MLHVKVYILLSITIFFAGCHLEWTKDYHNRIVDDSRVKVVQNRIKPRFDDEKGIIIDKITEREGEIVETKTWSNELQFAGLEGAKNPSRYLELWESDPATMFGIHIMTVGGVTILLAGDIISFTVSAPVILCLGIGKDTESSSTKTAEDIVKPANRMSCLLSCADRVVQAKTDQEGAIELDADSSIALLNELKSQNIVTIEIQKGIYRGNYKVQIPGSYLAQRVATLSEEELGREPTISTLENISEQHPEQEVREKIQDLIGDILARRKEVERRRKEVERRRREAERRRKEVERRRKEVERRRREMERMRRQEAERQRLAGKYFPQSPGDAGTGNLKFLWETDIDIEFAERYIKAENGSGVEQYKWERNTISQPVFAFDAPGYYVRAAKANIDGNEVIFTLVFHIESLADDAEIFSVDKFTKLIFDNVYNKDKRYTLSFKTASELSYGEIYLGKCEEPYLLGISDGKPAKVKNKIQISSAYSVNEVIPSWWKAGHVYEYTLQDENTNEIKMEVEVANHLTWEISTGSGVVDITKDFLEPVIGGGEVIKPIISPNGSRFMSIRFSRK